MAENVTLPVFSYLIISPEGCDTQQIYTPVLLGNFEFIAFTNVTAAGRQMSVDELLETLTNVAAASLLQRTAHVNAAPVSR